MSNQAHHIVPLRVYLALGMTLFALTVITVMVSFFDFGGFNLVVAMMIATVKGSLVALYFMHLKYDNKLYLSIFTITLLFLGVFIMFTLFDTLNRGQIYQEKDKPIQERAKIYE